MLRKNKKPIDIYVDLWYYLSMVKRRLGKLKREVIIMYQITYQSNVSIKSLKYFPDHEGYMIPQGNIYLNNKKVGSFIADSWGGETMFHFSNADVRKEVEKAMETDLKKIGFRTPHSDNKTALLDVKEDFIYHIGKVDKLVKCLKNLHRSISTPFL